MSPRESSLVWRLAGLILGGAGLVLLAVLYVSHSAQRRIITDEQHARSDALALAAANHIETQLGRAETAVQSAVTAWLLLPPDRDAATTLIERTLQAQPQLFGMAIALPAGEAPSTYRILYGFRDRGFIRVADREQPERDYQEDWFYLPFQLRRPVWSEPYFDPVAQTNMVTYSAPVLRDGRVVAVLTGDLPLAWLHRLLGELGLEEGSSAVLLSKQGFFIAHPDRRVEMRETVFSLAESLSTPEATAELQGLGWAMLRNAPGERFYRRPLDGRRAYINHRPISGAGWAMGIIVPEDRMLAALNRQTRINLLVGAGGLLLLALAAISTA